MEFMVNNASRFTENNINVPDVSCEPINGEKTLNKEHTERQDEDYAKLFELIEDGKQPLYERCKKYSKLSFLIRLYHIKCLCRMTDKAMGMILELLKDAFEDAKISASFYEAKKTINKLGLNYTKIHACPNDCMLYFGKDDEGLQECKKCKTSRWKDKNKKQPAKILRYFPLKPRLQRLYMCSKTAESMRWHFFGGNQDGLMRHPRGSQAWKTFDLLHPEFAADPRNVRLGLANDGFNPFGAMSTTYSIWPVILIPYNRPPWECMRQSSFILSMIIPGKKMPRNDIDVYLQPLIQELRELWYDGVQTFDSLKKETFKMRATLMWTISDFPGLGNLSGWNIYTEFACPTCNFATDSYRLIHSRKWCFMGHRRFLESCHRFRLQRLRFNGKIEQREPPITLSRSDILKQMEGIPVNFGEKTEMNNKRKRAKGKLVKDQHQVTKTVRMKIRDVHNMEKGLRIIVECDEYAVPIGKAAGIIAGVMGQLATNALYFPISFKKWPDMPDSYLDRVFYEILMARFLFMIDHQKAKKWAGSNLNKKWKDHRHKLWHAAKNPLLSKEEIIRKSLNGIPMDQWALFVNYRMDEKTQKLCKKNQQIRQDQIPHTGGAKSLARRRAEMMAKGKAVDRGKMWTETHKRKDGSYVTEAAREIGEKIEEIRSQRPESIIEVSPNDALGIILGPKHPGRVRGLGLGCCSNYGIQTNI